MNLDSGVGLVPDAGCTFLLARVIGLKRAMEMLLTDRVLDAAQAPEWGWSTGSSMTRNWRRLPPSSRRIVAGPAGA